MRSRWYVAEPRRRAVGVVCARPPPSHLHSIENIEQGIRAYNRAVGEAPEECDSLARVTMSSCGNNPRLTMAALT